MIVFYIIIALLVFGFLIFIHELGHFLFAKRFGVAINEFSIGMGPKIFSKIGKDGVTYSLRAFPIGGYVAMVGEEEESDNPNAFCKKAAWKRFIIVVAGAIMNLLIGFLIMTILTLSSPRFGGTTIGRFEENSLSSESGLMVDDEIIKINNKNVHVANELSYRIMHSGSEPVSVTLIRDGNKLTIDGVIFPQIESQGISFGEMDFLVYEEPKTFSTIVKNSFYSCKLTVSMVWDSLTDLISGKYGFEHVSGPVGVTGAITDAAKTGTYNLFFVVVIIAVNLGIFNLLPIPALDGGTLVFLLIEMIFRKPVPKKIEEGLKMTGFALLMLLVLIVTLKDVINLF